MASVAVVVAASAWWPCGSTLPRRSRAATGTTTSLYPPPGAARRWSGAGLAGKAQAAGRGQSAARGGHRCPSGCFAGTVSGIYRELRPLSLATRTAIDQDEGNGRAGWPARFLWKRGGSTETCNIRPPRRGGRQQDGVWDLSDRAKDWSEAVIGGPSGSGNASEEGRWCVIRGCPPQSYAGIQALALGNVSFTAASRNGCRLDWMMTTRPSKLAINLPGSSPLSPDRWRDGGLSAGVMAIVRTVVETKSRRQLISIGAAVCR